MNEKNINLSNIKNKIKYYFMHSDKLIQNIYFKLAIIISLITVTTTLYLINYITYFFAGLSILIGTLIFYKISSKTQNNLFGHNIIIIPWKITLIIYFTTIIVYLIDMYTSAYFQKGIFSFIIISICAVSIYLTSSYTKLNKPFFELILLIFFTTLIYLSNWLIFPNGLYAPGDSHWQIKNMILPLMTNFEIPNTLYSAYPMHQIFVSISSIFLSISPFFSYFFMSQLIYIILTFFAYLFGRLALNHNVGIICGILFAINTRIYSAAEQPFQFTYTLAYAIILLYIFIKLNNYSKQPDEINWNHKFHLPLFILFIVLSISLLYSHHFTALIFAFFMLIILLASKTIIRTDQDKKIKYLFFLFAMLLIVQWIYASQSMLIRVVNMADLYSTAFFGVDNYMSSINTGTSVAIKSGISQSIGNLFLNFLDNIEYYYIFLLVASGTFYGIWARNKIICFLGICGITLYSITVIGIFIHVPIFLSGRMMTYIYAACFITISAYSFFILTNALGKKQIIYSSLFLVFIIIFSLGSTSACSSTSLFLGEKPIIDYYDTYTELKTETWIGSNIPENSIIYMGRYNLLSVMNSEHKYSFLPINNLNRMILFQAIPDSAYFILNERDFRRGVYSNGISEAEQKKLISEKKLDSTEIYLQTKQLLKLNEDNVKLSNEYSNKIFMSKYIKIHFKHDW